MTSHENQVGECGDSAGTLTGSGAQDSDSPNEDEGARGRLPGLPGTEKDDCKPTYESHGLSGIGGENSPSCGWRGVCWEMGVMPDGHD